MLTALEIENFKGIRDRVRIDLRPVTLLFGANSSGKSSIIHAIHYLCEVLLSQNYDAGLTASGGQSIDLGGFENFVFDHEEKTRIKFAVEMDFRNVLIKNYLWNEHLAGYYGEPPLSSIMDCADDVRIELEIGILNGRKKPSCTCYSVIVNHVVLATIKISESSPDIGFVVDVNPFHPFTNLSETDSSSRNAIDVDFAKWIWNPIFERMGNLDGSTNQLDFSFQCKVYDDGDAIPITGRPLSFDIPKYFGPEDGDEVVIWSAISAILVGPIDVLRQELGKFRYLGPLRDIPRRGYTPARSLEQGRWASGIAAWDELHTCSDATFEEVRNWLSSKEKLDAKCTLVRRHYRTIDVSASEAANLLNRDSKAVSKEQILDYIEQCPLTTKVSIVSEASSDLELRDVGVGLSQVIPLIVIAVTQRDSLIAIEQPELHLHPKFQAALGDLLIRASKNTMIVETHSEHMILRILRRIRETNENELPVGYPAVNPDEIAVHYIESTANGAKVTRLRIDKEGEFIDRWPYGFFDERAEELF